MPGNQKSTGGVLPIYQPRVTCNDIYFYHPGRQPALKYNHDVDIVKFKGRFLAAWNANEVGREDVPGQFNYLSVSDDFETWTEPVRQFMADADCENPVDSDNQWQPAFINWRDDTLFCAWCDYNARRTFVSRSGDGLRWRNRDVPIAPPALAGHVSAFPTNHGLLTRRGRMMFPCSLPEIEEKCIVGHTRFAGVLMSDDAGESWFWSEPIEAASWSEMGENPDEFGGETVYLWEPMLFEHADGRLGMLIRNSSAQDAPERPEKPHRMLLYAWSDDHGRTWSRAMPVEVDTICSRNYAVSGVGRPDSLLMVMNDNHVQVPERISRDRYFLSLYCSPVCNPDLLLPGPVVQPSGGTAFYPNGFVDDDRLYLAYTYPQGIHSSVVSPLPDFSRPFLLPRGGRDGLSIDGNVARFSQRQSCLGLVLNEDLTRRPEIRLAFDFCVHRYNGGPFPILTLGGKTAAGTSLRVLFNQAEGGDVLQVQGPDGNWLTAARLELRRWVHVDVALGLASVTLSVNGAAPRECHVAVLRKICFGGLYETPEWPRGMAWSSDIRLRLDTLSVQS